MPLYVLTCIDKPDGLPLRLETRPAHLAYMDGSGKVKLGGPFLGPAGDPVGSLVIVDVEDEAAALAFSQADPYRKAGLFESVDIRAFRVVAGELT